MVVAKVNIKMESHDSDTDCEGSWEPRKIMSKKPQTKNKQKPQTKKQKPQTKNKQTKNPPKTQDKTKKAYNKNLRIDSLYCYILDSAWH